MDHSVTKQFRFNIFADALAAGAAAHLTAISARRTKQSLISNFCVASSA